MTMADTIAVMNAGVIEQLGDPAELYEHPRTTFVANFLGQSNLLPGTPTFSDAGIDLAITNWRGVVAPGTISDAKAAALADLVTKAVKTDVKRHRVGSRSVKYHVQ